MKKNYARFDPKPGVRRSVNPYSMSVTGSDFASLLPIDSSQTVSASPYGCIITLGRNYAAADFKHSTPACIYDSSLPTLGARVGAYLAGRSFSQIAVHGLVEKLLQHPSYSPTNGNLDTSQFELESKDFDLFVHGLADSFEGRYDLSDLRLCSPKVVEFPYSQDTLLEHRA